MKFECEKTLLASAIDGVSRAITNRAAIPVLEGIYMKAEGFNLTLTGYDMEMGITTTIECNVLVPGETVLDAKLLSAMVNRMPAGDVCIELNDEGQAKISGGVAEFEIPALNASDYPSLPVTGADNTMTVKCGMLREMIEKTIYAVSQDDKKPAHTGELFVIEPGSLTIVALDGYRLAIIQRDVECTRDIRIIIPAKTLQELLKIMGGADDDVKIDANRRYVVFTSNGYTIMSRLIEGDFLNYESVIPKDRKTRVTVECKNFIDTIERASLIITERLKNPLRISFAEDRVTVRCQTPLGKVVDEFAPVSMEGDAVEIGFNNRYLLDALRFSKCEKMVLGEPDESGRRRPVGTGEFFDVDCDNLVIATGTSYSDAVVDTTTVIEKDKWAGIATDASGKTSRPGVFAGGDAVTGPQTVVKAMGAGKQAAVSIDAYLSGEPLPTLAKRQGYGEILAYPYYGEGIGAINSGMIVRRDFVEKNPERVMEMLRAHRKATEQCMSDKAFWLETSSKMFGVELDVLRDAADNMELVWDMDDTFMKQLSALGKRMLELGIIKKEPDYNALVDRRFVAALRQGQ